MRRIVFQIVLSLLSMSVQAQKVSNIRAEQRGQDIVVFYYLETTSPCEVSLTLSQNNGETWSAPLKNVFGGVGKNVSSGEKQITWNVLESREQLVGEKIKFKIIANGKKAFEPEMVFVEGGTYKMGSNSGRTNEKPVHEVTLDSFYIGRFEITQLQWKEVMGVNPSYFKDFGNISTDLLPVEQVSLIEIREYILKLNALTGRTYRLPTEAEWEYAARGGNKSKGFRFSGSNDLDSVAWYSNNSDFITHNVGAGMKKTNELGIYDMSGNVWEWCSNVYGKYMKDGRLSEERNMSSEYYVIRGGGMNSERTSCRVCSRAVGLDKDKLSNCGLRLVLSMKELK